MSNNYYLYFSGRISTTITKSQVFSWLELLRREGIVFDIIVTVPLIDLIKIQRLKSIIQTRREISRSHDVYLFPVFRSKSNDAITRMVFFLYVGYIISRKGRRKDKIIIQTRETKHPRLIKKLKGLSRRIKFVFEHRGVGAEEYINNLGYIDIFQVENDSIRKKYSRIKHNYKLNFEVADKIINVSNKMNEYIYNEFGPEYSEKIKVIPGAADEVLFAFREQLKKDKRNELNISDKTVFIYSGRLAPKYHMKEFLFKVFKTILKKVENAYIICITSDISHANDLLKTNQINEKDILIIHLDNSEINSFLNAGDFALIFREDLATNRYASPTKIAEYLLAGLPLIMSESIGDYSSFAETRNLGVIVKNTVEDVLKKFDDMPIFNRTMNAKLSAENYSKQSFIPAYITMYSDL